ncbi:hypothetical protein MMC22_003130 [Lobaria immixta]|nr:hypothetical protein [Lobaria immixta]
MTPHATIDPTGYGADSYCSLPKNSHGDPDQQVLPSVTGSDLIEPVAVVGLSFKLPRDASSVDSFWNILMEQRSTATRFPKDRLSDSAVYHPDPNRRGAIPFRGGHFVDSDIAAFDSPFFAISDSEAASLDPQQRGLLETTYRALENAGMPLKKAFGSKTSVYTGCFTNDWQQLSLKDAESCSSHAGLGIEASMNANRISWFFDFKGTSFNVDSACSSSLVALDLACTSLICRDTNMSIAAGCNLIFYPDLMHALSNMNLLSPDNQCFSFDSRANGYARGEGFGVLVLKRLSDALQDNDVIRAVIRSTGSNQDGHTPGITQPSGDAQAALIRETYKKTGLAMNKTRFFEAHGTGTAIGDPIEANALGEVFRHSRTSDDPLYVGALKSNIGHLEGASGIASVIKTILALEKAVIPPNTNFRQINPRIDAEFLRIKFPTEPVPWPTKGLRRASVNSFGFGGTNAHAILDDAFHYLRDHGLVGNHSTVQDPPPGEILRSGGILTTSDQHETETNQQACTPQLLVLSASDKGGLERQAAKYTHFFSGLSTCTSINSYLESLSYTLNSRRSLLPWKSYLLAESKTDLDQLGLRMSPGHRSVSKPALGFIFTGQGAQWAGMGCQLGVFDIFEQRLREAENYLIEIGCGWRLREELHKQEGHSKIHKPEFSQPISTAVQIALVDLLRSFDIHPAVVVGHSSGEIAAAYCFGAISANAALKIAYYRGTFAASLTGYGLQNGAMMSVGLSEVQIQPYFDQFTNHSNTGSISVACINSHKNITLSGDADEIDALERILKSKDVFTRKLVVGIAYHSPHMQIIARDYGLSIQKLEKDIADPNTLSMISSVTGQRATADQLCTPQYWVDNMVSPVKFSTAVGQICGQSTQQIRKKLDCSHRNSLQVNILLEIGPHSALQGSIRDILTEVSGGANIGYASVLVRRQPAVHTMLSSLGQLHCRGYSIDLSKVNRLNKEPRKRPQLLHDLPEYPFDHSRRYWEESRVSKRLRLHHQTKLDLLGKPVPDWNPLEAKWRNFIRVSEMPWIEDHMINETLIYPAAGMLVMAIEAAYQMKDTSRVVAGFELRDVLFQKALKIPQDSEGIETILYLRQIHNSDTAASWSEFRLCSFENDDWVENCRGHIRVKYQMNPGPVDGGKESLEELNQCRRIDDKLSQLCTEAFDPTKLYQTLRNCGFGFGHTFQPLKNGLCSTTNEAKSDVVLYQWPASEHPQQHVVHPTTLDGILHLSVAALAQGGRKLVSTAVPSLLRKMWVAKSGLSYPDHASVKAAAWVTALDSRGTEFDISVLDESKSHVLARVEGLRSTVVADLAELSLQELPKKQVCYHLELKPDLDVLDREQLTAFCAEARYRPPEPVQFYRDLTFLLFMFLSNSVETLDTIETKSVQPHLRKYLDWAKLQLKKYYNGELPYSEPEWQSRLQNNEYVELLCDDVAATNNLGRVFVTTGRSLPSILCGEVEPLEFLFGETNLLRDLYCEVNGSRTCFPEFARYLDALSHKNPTMRVLEIGAGTGGITQKILSTLLAHDGAEPGKPRYSSYVYTDLSPAFFEKAQTDFRHYSNITFKTLDIESDPSLQGYKTEEYDLIIAANVLHAARNINVTMQHVRKLLKPGGKLMMYEPTQPDILRTGFIAGLMEGWWLGSESYRKWSPSLTCESWEKVLHNNGFSGLDLEIPDFVRPECQESSILISTAISNTSEKPNCSRFVFVADLKSSLQLNIAQQLATSLLPEGGLSSRVLGLDEAASLADKGDLHFVFLIELEQPLLNELCSRTFAALQELLTSSKSVFWVSGSCVAAPKGPEYAIINGLSRVLRNENPERPFAALALDIQGSITERQLQNIRQVFRIAQLSSGSLSYEPEFVEIDGLLNIPRAVRANQLSQDLFLRSLPQQSAMRTFRESPPLKLAIKSPGLLDTFYFGMDDDYRCPLASDDIEVEVRVVGMNFRDCLVALGRIPGSSFGTECAGVVTRVGECCDLLPGDRVVMSAAETFKTFARGKANQVFKIDDAMTFVEAASIPSQFGTAWQAVHGLACLKKGETILIHAGAGGTGQAAIQVSQYLGAEVFATVGSETKKQVLMEEYGIQADHIFYSRDISFAKGIMRITGNRGVDVIINSLAGDSLVASWECLAPYGRFIEIGKKDILSNSSLPMYPFRKNASFICFDGFMWQLERPIQAREGFQTIFKLFAERKLHAVRPLHAYPASKVEEAFRLMQDGKIAGKIVLEVTPDTEIPTILETKPSFHIDGKGTYLIAGGLGGLGRSISRWLVDRGAKNLILLSRSGAKSDASLMFLEELKQRGAKVAAPPCDVTDKSFLKTVLEQCAIDMPRIKGCIQGSMVLRDALFDKMSNDDWRLGTDCKIAGSWNLHTLLPEDLDFFIMLSSASGVVGLRGQANYAAGNTYMDALARYRVAHGRRAISLDLGALTDDGLLAENTILLNRVLAYGALNPISRKQCFAILDYYCDPALPIMTPRESQAIIGLGTGAGPGLDGIALSRQAIFRHLHADGDRLALIDADAAAEENTNFKELFATATSLADAAATVSQALIKKLSKTLSALLQSEVEMDKPLAAYGVDSLLAVELRSWIAKEFLSDVAVFEISGSSTLSTVGRLVAARSKAKHASWTS